MLVAGTGAAGLTRPCLLAESGGGRSWTAARRRCGCSAGSESAGAAARTIPSTGGGFVRGARFVFRTLGGLATGKRLIGLGGALSCSLTRIVRTQQTSVWLSSPIVDLIVENDAVTGAMIDKNGRRKPGASRPIRAGQDSTSASAGVLGQHLRDRAAHADDAAEVRVGGRRSDAAVGEQRLDHALVVARAHVVAG